MHTHNPPAPSGCADPVRGFGEEGTGRGDVPNSEGVEDAEDAEDLHDNEDGRARQAGTRQHGSPEKRNQKPRTWEPGTGNQFLGCWFPGYWFPIPWFPGKKNILDLVQQPKKSFQNART